MVLTHAMERGLDPARRFERDAVGRERVSRPRRAVPAAPDGLGRPARDSSGRAAKFDLCTDRDDHEEDAVDVYVGKR